MNVTDADPPSGAEPPLPESFAVPLNTPMASTRGELLRFDAVRYAGGAAGTDLAASWVHMLLDGSGIESILTDLSARVRGIALDVANGKIYWTGGDDGLIRRANFDGTGVESAVTLAPGTELSAVAVGGPKIYWTDRRADKIQRAKHSDHHGFQDQEGDHEFLDAGFNRIPTRKNANWRQ